MKNLKMFFMATVLVAGAMFTSCTPEAVTTVTITLDKTSVDAGTAITGKIAAEGTLTSVTLLKDSGTVTNTVKGWPKTTFTTADPVTLGAAGSYTVRIESLTAGSYTLKATDKNGVESSQKFTVVDTTPVLTALTSATTILCTLADGSNNTTCASADGSVYAPKSATAAQQATIDFVYFYGGMYAPSNVPTSLTATFTAWTTKNATKFAKSTSIAYATATYADVKTAADAATATSVTALAANDVVVFKTVAGKVGVFKVNSITAGYASSDNVVINIKVVK